MTDFLSPEKLGISVTWQEDPLFEQFKFIKRSTFAGEVLAMAVNDQTAGKDKTPSTIAIADLTRIHIIDAHSGGYLEEGKDTKEPTEKEDLNSSGRIISKIKDTVTSLSYRHDQKALLAGDNSGTLHFFNEKGLRLRMFKGHVGAVRCCQFIDNQHILSGGEDGTIRILDIREDEGVPAIKFVAHSDQIKSLIKLEEPSEESFGMWASGSTDTSVKIWNIAKNQTVEPVASYNLKHSNSVESICLLPDDMLAVASGNTVYIWDYKNDCEEAKVILNPHVSTVTSLKMSPDNGALVTSSLDKTLKVWKTPAKTIGKDNLSFKCIASVEMTSGITIFQFLPKDLKSSEAVHSSTALPGVGGLVIGTTSGEWVLRKSRTMGEKKIRADNKRKRKRAENTKNNVITLVHQRNRLGNVDRLLKGFQFQAAWDKALEYEVDSTTSVLLELLQSNKLHFALRRREVNELIPTLNYIENLMTLSPLAKEYGMDLLDSLIDSNRESLNTVTEGPVLEKLEALRKLIVFDIGVTGVLSEIRGYLSVLKHVEEP